MAVIITMCSGKGGVGKSVLTSNLGVALARLSVNVMIVDADIVFPNQHLLFGVEPAFRLEDIAHNNVSVEKAALQLRPNLRLLAGSTGRTEPSPDIRPAEIVAQCAVLDADCILIDAPAGAGVDVLECCALSDRIIVVMTDEPTSLLDAYGMIKILHSLDKRLFIRTLVNNAVDTEDAGEALRKLGLATEKFLGFIPDNHDPVLYDRAVRTSLIRQEILVETVPESETSAAIERLALSLKSYIGVHH